MSGVPTEALKRVPLFAELTDDEIGQIARLFKVRRFRAGETVIQEGSGGAAFFVIETGEANVFVHSEQKTTLSSGDYFGEIALIDEGTRSASITAASDLVCYGVTFWDFRPLVESNGAIGWKLLQSMTRLFRAARES
ncbi:MAG TPA: cyclic nucleotide-binding domain-containing protein [Solirubrobacteraceae bacterium]|nr:cyclic nucleotide-binding domain-containing protein [Solirubrobacteraceae bacterium]